MPTTIPCHHPSWITHISPSITNSDTISWANPFYMVTLHTSCWAKWWYSAFWPSHFTRWHTSHLGSAIPHSDTLNMGQTFAACKQWLIVNLCWPSIMAYPGPWAHNSLLIKWLLGQIKDTYLTRLNFAVTWSKGSFWNSNLRPWSSWSPQILEYISSHSFNSAETKR